MASKIIEAHKAPNGYHFLIHLDTDQVVNDPEDETRVIPDPLWLHEITFCPLQPSQEPLHPNGGHEESGAFHHACVTQHGKDLTEEEYLENIEAQLPGMVELELHRRRGTTHHQAAREAITEFVGKEL